MGVIRLRQAAAPSLHLLSGRPTGLSAADNRGAPPPCCRSVRWTQLRSGRPMAPAALSLALHGPAFSCGAQQRRFRKLALFSALGVAALCLQLAGWAAGAPVEQSRALAAAGERSASLVPEQDQWVAVEAICR